MPSIADQVATMEHDHAAALAEIDTLTSSLAAMKAALASTTNENLLLREQNQALNDFANETRATVETLALGTMELLRASRRSIGGQPVNKILPFAVVKPKPGERFFGDELLAKASTLPAAWPTATEAVVAAAMNADVQSDSGDEQPMTEAGEAQRPMTDAENAEEQQRHEQRMIEARDASNANAIASQPEEAWPVVPPVNEFTVREMAGPTLVVHDDHDLPIFLTRDRPYINAADRAIFG